MVDYSPEKKAWLANAAQAYDFALTHGGESMTPEDRVVYESMMQRTADARSTHDLLETAARIVARADGLGISVTGRWLAFAGATLTYLGALWMVLYSVSGGDIPAPALGDSNTTIGASALVIGVALWVTGAALRRAGRRRALR